MRVGSMFQVVVSSSGAVRLAGLYFLYGFPLLEGDERVINHKLAEAVELGAEGLSVSWDGLRKTKGGRVAADLTISETSIAVKYNVYLRRDDILLQFRSTDRSHAELVARLLRLAGVGAEVRKEDGRDVWRVEATTDKLAAGHEKLRKALAEIVKTARSNGWMEADKAEGWLEKLEGGLTLREGWPKYQLRLVEGALVVRYQSTNSGNIEREAQRLRQMGLKEGRHFTVKMPEGDRYGYVRILREGLAYAAWLSVHGTGRQRELVAEFVKYILQRAKEAGEKVYEKAKEIVEEGGARGSLKLEGFEKEVEVDGRRHVVKVIDGKAVKEKQNGKTLLRIRITVEVDGVRREYTITYSRRGGDNAALGFAYARADAERLGAVIKALTGRRPGVYRMKNGKIMIVYYEGHLKGFMRYTELADAITKWLEETGR